MTWIQTYTGRQFWPLQPSKNDIVIEDIAHALAYKCRFNGHTRRFYSIAQHSVIVSRAVPDSCAMHGLMHDAAEAYLPDVASPIKPRFASLLRAEAILERAIAARFGLFGPPPEAIRQADLAALMAEKRDLLGPSPAPWALEGKIEPLPARIWALGPEVAEELFLARFREIKRSTWKLQVKKPSG